MSNRQFSQPKSNLVKAMIGGVATFVSKGSIKRNGKVRHGTALGTQVNSPVTMQHQGGLFITTDDGQSIGMATPDFLVAAAAVLSENGYTVTEPKQNTGH